MGQGLAGRPKRLERVDLETMRAMVSADPSLLEARDEFEETPLLRAAARGRADV